MTAVIFGGHGFIGSHLARELISSGRYDKVISADIAPVPRFETAGVEYMYCDVTSRIPDDLVPGAAEIYNLAAIHVTPGHQDWEYYWTNISGALNVTDFARRAKVKTLFFTSSISVYGSQESQVCEASPLNVESTYGRSKLLAEQIHKLWQSEEPAVRRLIIVRPAAIFGYQERGNFTRLAKLLRRGAFIYPGRKDTVKACGYVKDLVKSFEFVKERTQSLTVYNFAFDERLTTEQICDAFCEVAQLSRPKLVFPMQLILFIGWMFEFFARIGIRTSINQARVLKLFRSTNVTPKLLKELSFARQFNLTQALKDWRSYSSTGEFE